MRKSTSLLKNKVPEADIIFIDEETLTADELKMIAEEDDLDGKTEE